MLIQRPDFNASYSYAINPASFKTRGRSSSVEVISFFVKRGISHISMGTLSSSKAVTLEEFMEANDLGMNTNFRWNGIDMWSSENVFVKEMAAWKYLDALHRQASNRSGFANPDLSLAPAGYVGWYARK